MSSLGQREDTYSQDHVYGKGMSIYVERYPYSATFCLIDWRYKVLQPLIEFINQLLIRNKYVIRTVKR